MATSQPLSDSLMFLSSLRLNNLLSKIQAHVFQRLPGKIFTMDNYNSLQIESTSSDGYQGHSTVEEIVPKYLTSKNKIDSYRKISGRK